MHQRTYYATNNERRLYLKSARTLEYRWTRFGHEITFLSTDNIKTVIDHNASPAQNKVRLDEANHFPLKDKTKSYQHEPLVCVYLEHEFYLDFLYTIMNLDSLWSILIHANQALLLKKLFMIWILNYFGISRWYSSTSLKKYMYW